MKRFYESVELAQNYLKFRPDYSDSKIAEKVVEYYRQYNDHKEKINLMIDVGCGNGQSSNIFQGFCKKIIGCDVSLEQLHQAKSQNEYKHIQYKEGTAEKLEMENNSVDLVTAGMAAHWFDLQKFFSEVERILKPSGCLSIFGYFMPEISLLQNSTKSLTQHGTYLLHSLLASAASENPAFLSAHFSLQNHYEEIFESLPFKNKKRIDDIHVITTASINDICGFIRSTHIWESYLNQRIAELKSADILITKELIDLFDIATHFKFLIRKLWNLDDVSDDETILKVDFPFFILLANPQKVN